jgi:hypothetical protein
MDLGRKTLPPSSPPPEELVDSRSLDTMEMDDPINVKGAEISQDWSPNPRTNLSGVLHEESCSKSMLLLVLDLRTILC